jgi:type II secretory pathway pseudopilin PulG
MNDDSLKLPKRTTPTWEIELLISGATAFGLIQLLGASDDWFLRLQLWLNNAPMLMILNPLQIYVRIALICLTIAILVHLLVRAYWVALIGLHSVYRGPPDISKIASGPYTRRAIEADTQDVPAQIEKADNLATQIFGYGIGMALMMLIPSALVLLTLGAAQLLDLFLPSQKAVNIALLVLALPIFLLFIIPSMLDQYFGKRIPEHSILGRSLSKFFLSLRRYSLGVGNNVIVVYMMSRAGSYRGAVIGSIVSGFVLSIIAVAGMPRLQSMQDSADFSRDWETSDYASERGNNLTYARRAYISAPQVRGEYLEVSVPIPNKSPSGGHGSCSKDTDAKTFIECLKRDLVLRIDNSEVKASWLLVKPRSGQPATLRTLLDVRELPRGAHQLLIEYPFDRKHPKDAWVELIHFWK